MAEDKMNADEAIENAEQEAAQEANEAKQGLQNEMREQMMRLAAEFDNYKKRVKNDVENAAVIGKANMAKDLLPIIDEFELALIAAGKSDDNGMVKGMEMLYSNLLDAMKKNGLSEINSDGLFDPYKHEIVMVKESDREDGMILEVVKKGYMLNGIMLRPSSVIVAKTETKEKTENKNDGI